MSGHLEQTPRTSIRSRTAMPSTFSADPDSIGTRPACATLASLHSPYATPGRTPATLDCKLHRLSAGTNSRERGPIRNKPGTGPGTQAALSHACAPPHRGGTKRTSQVHEAHDPRFRLNKRRSSQCTWISACFIRGYLGDGTDDLPRFHAASEMLRRQPPSWSAPHERSPEPQGGTITPG